MSRSPGSLTCSLRTPNPEDTRDPLARAWQLMPLLIFVAGLVALTADPAVVPSAHAAAPCQVPSKPYPTIQAAVDRAKCATITAAAGTYPELVVIARNVIIRGAGQDNTSIDGGGSGPVLTVASGTVTIQDITIQHGWSWEF